MAGSALIFQKGHYLFGNADQNSLANQNGLGNQLLQNHEQRQQELNERRNANDGVFVSEETDLAKKRRGRPKYDTDKFLLKENGLDRIEKDCKDWKFKGKGHERSDLKKLIKLYREWAIQMYPSMRFEDLVRKTVTFSSQYKVKNHLQKLRDQRDGVQVFGDEVKEEDEDMDLDIQMDNNNEDRPQRQLQREADEDAPQANPPQNDRNTNNNNDYARNSELGAVLVPAYHVPQSVVLEQYTNDLWQQMVYLYDKYIKWGSDHELNISYETRNSLQEVFETRNASSSWTETDLFKVMDAS
eukprot:147073_1